MNLTTRSNLDFSYFVKKKNQQTYKSKNELLNPREISIKKRYGNAGQKKKNTKMSQTLTK